MNRFAQVGFSQRIRLEWLERTAKLIAAGTTREVAIGELREMLRDKLSLGGDPERGNREKAITILSKIWITAPGNLEPLRRSGLELLSSAKAEERLAIHWGMAMAVYPFLGAVASSAGRLLKLQGTATAAQVQRRVREKYGERETVSRAARRVLRSFVDWGVITESTNSGVYQSRPAISISNAELSAWLVEATLRASTQTSVALKVLLESPSLFPFRLETVSASALAASEHFEIVRQGLDEDMVMLRS